jgi:D-sedoheptulose 7-phosphate isomerase
VAVEFLHPVIVGKRALPALALTNDIAAITTLANGGAFDDAFADQVRCLARNTDVAMGISCDGNCMSVIHGLRAARQQGLLTVALCGGTGGTIAHRAIADFILITKAQDRLIVKEVQMTIYHILWELVHVFLEQQPIHARTR